MQYRDAIRTEYTRRRERNPSYSLRSFARDLDVSASQLSEVMNQKKNMSRKMAQKIANQIGLRPEEAELFILSTEIESESSIRPGEQSWQAWLEKNRIQKELGRPVNLDETRFKLISELRPHVLFATFGLKNFRLNYTWLSTLLGVFQSQLRDLFKRLEAIGAIQWTPKGEPELLAERFSSTEGVPSQSIRQYHRSTLQHAIECLDKVPVHERDVRSMIFAVRQSDFESIQKDIIDFQKQLYLKYGKNPEADRIYGIQSQWVPYTEKQ